MGGCIQLVLKEGLDACQDTKDKLIVLGLHPDGWSDPTQFRITYNIESTQDASSTNFTCALPNKHRSSAITFSTKAALVEMGPEAAGVKAIIAGKC